jgi:hypothetical protein
VAALKQPRLAGDCLRVVPLGLRWEVGIITPGLRQGSQDSPCLALGFARVAPSVLADRMHRRPMTPIRPSVQNAYHPNAKARAPLSVKSGLSVTAGTFFFIGRLALVAAAGRAASPWFVFF